ncbi:MAG: hypothetical protein ACI9G1_002912 [Pirellulaceae bacterium]|jgi:hypothetical protein
MSKFSPVRNAVTLLTLAVLSLICMTNAAPAQEPSPSDQPAKVEKKSKFRGRLPAYFKSVVSEPQRAEIYKIQESYYNEIQALQAKIKEMVTKRDAEVQDVLTDKQLDQVDELSTAAATRRAKKVAEANETAEGSSTESDTSTETPSSE